MRPRIKEHDIDKVIKVIVSESLGVSSLDVPDNYSIESINGLEASNIIIGIEEEFGIKIDSNTFKHFINVKSLVDYVEHSLTN